MTDTNAKRPRITGVTIDVVFPDGNSRTITIDPEKNEAVFWSDRAVIDILGEYYNTHDSYITVEELKKNFGEKAAKLAGKEEKIKVTKNLVEKLWKLESPDGYLLPMLKKGYKCIPS